jgi:nucleoside-diphosphate-sugar epimerase
VRILVTGHHGYVGSVLAPALQDAGHDVTGLDCFYYRGCDFGDGTRLAGGLERDARDSAELDLEGFDAVVHLAALSNDPLGDLNSSWTYQINLEAAVSLARRARDAGVGRFVFASSCAMYGAVEGDPLLDEHAPLAPLTPYAESKVAAEQAVRELADDGFGAVSMRCATAYGVSPRLRLDIVLNNLVAWAHTTGAIRLHSDGTSWRPIVHIRDIARACLALLEASPELIRGEAFNIGSAEQNYRIRELAEIVHGRLPACEVTFADGASSDPRSYRVDFSKFASAFPECRFEWTAERGADELASAYDRFGLTHEDLEGDRYIRLNRLKRLLSEGDLDDDLRWVKPEVAALS